VIKASAHLVPIPRYPSLDDMCMRRNCTNCTVCPPMAGGQSVVTFPGCQRWQGWQGWQVGKSYCPLYHKRISFEIHYTGTKTKGCRLWVLPTSNSPQWRLCDRSGLQSVSSIHYLKRCTQGHVTSKQKRSRHVVFSTLSPTTGQRSLLSNQVSKRAGVKRRYQQMTFLHRQ
jgi:hypothetical protein